MKKLGLLLALACLLSPASVLAQNCKFTQGETEYLDWAHCRYGEDAIVAVDLSENTSWEQCIYYVEAFRPPKLLAITKQLEDGTESLSINDRTQLGNPCYLTKQKCDKALAASGY